MLRLVCQTYYVLVVIPLLVDVVGVLYCVLWIGVLLFSFGVWCLVI